MKVADLSPEAREKIASYYMDKFREKHEGPFDWSYMLEHFDPEFIQINGHHVLMHLDTEHHPHITILRCIESNDGQSLTIFLKDKTNWYDSDPPDYEKFYTGFVAICDKVPGEDFFLCVFYHQWIIVNEDKYGASKNQA